MLCFWRWKQVYASTSTVDCDQVCNALSEAGVRYIRKGKTGHPVFFLGGDTGARMMASAMMETPYGGRTKEGPTICYTAVDRAHRREGLSGKRKGFGRQPFSKSFLLCIAG